MENFDNLFKNHLKENTSKDKILENFLKELKIEASKLQDVPLLSKTTTSNSLVKFKCMIQDVLDDEYSCSFVKNKDGEIYHSIFTDVVPEGFEMIDDPLIQRSIYFGIDVPGESEWSITKGKPKRQREDEEDHVNFGELKIKLIREDVEEIRINEIIEFTGVYNSNSLYAIHFKKLSSPYPFKGINNFKEAREETIKYINSYFQDELTSEYFLIHILSRIYSRNGNIPLGKLNVNLMNCYDIKTLETLISNIYPLMTKSKINDIIGLKLIPKKNYDNNRLEYGFLQLPLGTHLILDETNITEKEIKGKEVENLMILKRLIKDQIIAYDFGYYPLEFQVDIPILSCSKKKSVFDELFDIKLKLKDTGKLNDKLDLNLIRNYILTVKLNHENYTIEKDAQELIEKDFIKERQDNNVPQDILYHWLNLARLFTFSLGTTKLTSDIWKQMRSLEDKRKNSLK